MKRERWEVTQPPEGRHQVHEGGSPVAEHAGAVVAELVAQGEQVVGDVHAVVVVDGSQLGKLLQVLPGPARREKEEMGLFTAGSVKEMVVSTLEEHMVWQQMVLQGLTDSRVKTFHLSHPHRNCQERV